MSITASRSARDIAFTLQKISPKIFKNIFLNNGVLCLMGKKGRVKVVRGNRLDERVQLGQNTNVAHRDKYAPISTTYSDSWRPAQYGIAVIDGAAPVNFCDIDQNSGREKLSDMAEAIADELNDTFANKVSDALMATSTTGVDPTSLKVELPATAAGSQTQTTGGIARSDYADVTDRTSLWQTQYSNTSADLSAAAGIATVTNFIWTKCSDGSALDMQPDIGLTTTGVMAQASGGGDVLRRYTVDSKMLDFGFDNLKLGNTTIISDRSAATSSMYFINTNYARIQVIGGPSTKKTGSVKVIGDGAVDVPIQVRPPVESDNKLEYIIKAYLQYNFTLGGLKQHGLMDNLTEASLG